MVVEVVEKVVREPFRYIQWVLAAVLILGGLYIGSPWVDTSETTGSAVGKTLTTQVSLYIFALLYTAPGATLVIGLWKRWHNWVEKSLYFSFCLILFTSLLTILVNGLIPPQWLSSLSLGLITAIMWIRERYEKT